MAEELEINDSRVEFMAVYLLKTLKIKPDKWTKMYSVEDNKLMVHDFLDKNEQSLLVFSLNATQALVASYSYPNQLKAKACYFSKKNKEPITKDVNIKDVLVYGDLSYSPLDQLSAILDEVKFKKGNKLNYLFLF
jgi:dynein heavy chain